MALALQADSSRIHEMLEEVRQKTQARGAKVTHRRLNRQKYRNTIRDLFSLNEGRFDPTTEFPADERVHGFQNNGAALWTSEQLLRQYFRAADEGIDYIYKLCEVQARQPRIERFITAENSLYKNSKGFNIRIRDDLGEKAIAISEGMKNVESRHDAKLL